MSFEGAPIKVDDIKTMVQDLVKETEASLAKLIPGSFDDFESLVATHTDLGKPELGLIDEVSNSQPGYSLFTDTRNGYDQYSQTLLQYLVESKGFATNVSSNPPRWLWDHVKVLEFLALDAEFLEASHFFFVFFSTLLIGYVSSFSSKLYMVLLGHPLVKRNIRSFCFRTLVLPSAMLLHNMELSRLCTTITRSGFRPSDPILSCGLLPVPWQSAY
jgi:hypothetical protein